MYTFAFTQRDVWLKLLPPEPTSALKLLCVTKVAQRGASGGVLAGCGSGLGVALAVLSALLGLFFCLSTGNLLVLVCASWEHRFASWDWDGAPRAPFHRAVSMSGFGQVEILEVRITGQPNFTVPDYLSKPTFPQSLSETPGANRSEGHRTNCSGKPGVIPHLSRN